MKYRIVYHNCYRTNEDGGFRVYPENDPYLDEHTSMYAFADDNSYDTLAEAEHTANEYQNEYFAFHSELTEEEDQMLYAHELEEELEPHNRIDI